MKLLNCYISRFGIYSEERIEFSDGLTEFCKPNGSGKTTLVDFIRVMFYGMPRTSANSNLRRRYAPLNGGRYGGSLTFEKDGAEYRIERTFDPDKTRDSVAVYIDDVPAEGGIAENIGKFAFDLDETSFLQTVFIYDLTDERHSTPVINSRLGTTSIEENENNSYDSAIKLLQEAQRKYKPKLKDSLTKPLIGKVSELERSIANSQNTLSSMDAYVRRYEEAERELGELEKERRKAAQADLVREQWKHYDAAVAELAAKKAELNELNTKYVYGIPSPEVVEHISAMEEEMNRHLANADSLVADQRDIERKGYLVVERRINTLKEEELKPIYNKIMFVEQRKAAADALPDVRISEELTKKFGERTPTEYELSQWAECRQRISAAEEKAKSIKDQLIASPERRKLPIWAVIADVIGLVIAVVGGFLLPHSLIPAIVMLAVGGLGMVASGIVILTALIGKKEKSRIAQLRAELQQAEEEVKSETQRIYDYLAGYGYSPTGGVDMDWSKFVSDVAEYRNAVISQAEVDKKRNEIYCELDTTLGELLAFFAFFDADIRRKAEETGIRNYDFHAEYDALKDDLNEYRSILSRTEAIKSQRDEHRREADRLRASILDAIFDLAIPTDIPWQQIRSVITKDIANAELLQKDIADRTQALSKLQPTDERPADDIPAADDLDERINALKSELDRLGVQITACECAADRIEEQSAEVADLKAQIQKYEYRLELYDDTINMFDLAEQRLNERVVQPVKQRFFHYFEQLECAFGGGLTINRRFEIMVSSTGQTLPEFHLSTGQRAIVAFCFRLAIADVLYGDDGKPFVIMDDPFAKIDRQHFAALRSLMHSVCEDVQMIYFTCDESRSLINGAE